MNIFIYSQQRYLSSQKISTLNVEQLSEEELLQIIHEIRKLNLTLYEFENLAQSNGMKVEELDKLKIKLEKKNAFTNFETNKNVQNPEIKKDSNQFEIRKPFFSDIFGSEFFANDLLKFEPNQNAPVPENYILGVGDELFINVYGMQMMSHTVKINQNGKIEIPIVGEIFLNGVNIEASKTILKQKIGQVYKTLLNNQSQLSLTISKFRTIQVTVIGAKNPGNYQLSSLSTVFNALQISGGPSENGSFRKIGLYRNNKKIKDIDLYRFLVHGDQSDNINLKDNDLIKIEVYENRIKMEGEVKRAGTFELLSNENFSDLLTYCSGFKEDAYKSKIKLKTYTEKEQKIITLQSNDYATYVPKTGDVFKISKLLDRFENRVSIEGAVFRPEEYALNNEIRVTDLIKLADGLTENAYLDQAILFRKKEDFTDEVLSINLSKAIAGDPSHNIVLKKEDNLKIFSLNELKEIHSVQIEGEIQKPGNFLHVEGISLYHLILQAGGLKEGASNKIEISRQMKSDELMNDKSSFSEIFNIEITNSLEESCKSFILQPNDIVKIRKKPIFEEQNQVKINGCVNYPGNYTIKNNKEKIFEVIERAGGLRPDADIQSIKIKRFNKLNSDSTAKANFVYVPVNFKKIVKNPHSKQNIILYPNDEIIVSKFNDVVKILGEVNVPTEVPFLKNKSVRHYINSAGGFNTNKSKKNIYVVYSNGYASRTKNWIIFNHFPKIKPGCEIIVPEKREKLNKTTTGELIAISSLLGSFAGIAIAVLNFTSKN
ncbi:MAG: SLBB domain-containing protein [Flavobacteriia bacterium]|nr:SLBB domain-containing protein [Flavobacteriia bacterium]